MNLLVTSSPHIHSGRTTSRLMADVLLALIPAVLAGCYFFGLRAAILMVVSIASCKIAEFLWCAVRRQPHTLRDCSAAVTGLLLAWPLPVAVPSSVPVVGGFVAMLVLKGLGGGLGQNTFNPALAARGHGFRRHAPAPYGHAGAAQCVPAGRLPGQPSRLHR